MAELELDQLIPRYCRQTTLKTADHGGGGKHVEPAVEFLLDLMECRCDK